MHTYEAGTARRDLAANRTEKQALWDNWMATGCGGFLHVFGRVHLSLLCESLHQWSPILGKNFAFLPDSCWLQTSLALKFPLLINAMLSSYLLCRCLFPPGQLHEDSQI